MNIFKVARNLPLVKVALEYLKKLSHVNIYKLEMVTCLLELDSVNNNNKIFM